MYTIFVGSHRHQLPVYHITIKDGPGCRDIRAGLNLIRSNNTTQKVPIKGTMDLLFSPSIIFWNQKLRKNVIP